MNQLDMCVVLISVSDVDTIQKAFQHVYTVFGFILKAKLLH